MNRQQLIAEASKAYYNYRANKAGAKKKKFFGPKSRRPGTLIPVAPSGYAPFGSRKELSYKDIATTNVIPYAGLAAANAVIFLNGINQDNTIAGRLGSKVRMHSVYVRASMVQQLPPQAGGTVTGDTTRMMLVHDKNPNGAAPTLAAAAGAILVEATGESQLAPGTRNRFKIVRDWLYNGNQMTNAAGNVCAGTCANTVCIKDHIKLRPEQQIVVYGGTDATIGAIQTGGLFLCFMNGAAAAAASSCVINYTVRIRFEPL